MPINTTLVTGCAWVSALTPRRVARSISESRISLAKWMTWATISPAERFRARPPCPVAQKRQPMPHPTCVEMQAVRRSS